MKFLLVSIFLLSSFLFSPNAFTQTTQVPSSPGVVLPQSTPLPPAPTTTPAASSAQVSVAAPAAPPQWAQELLVFIQNMPVVGPIISKAIVYIGIVGSLITALVAFLLTALKALSGISGLAGLANLQTTIQNFKNGPIMYWLMYFSNFNAQKQPSVAAAVASAVKKAA
jgi:hypothetical protein